MILIGGALAGTIRGVGVSVGGIGEYVGVGVSVGGTGEGVQDGVTVGGSGVGVRVGAIAGVDDEGTAAVGVRVAVAVAVAVAVGDNVGVSVTVGVAVRVGGTAVGDLTCSPAAALATPSSVPTQALRLPTKTTSIVTAVAHRNAGWIRLGRGLATMKAPRRMIAV